MHQRPEPDRARRRAWLVAVIAAAIGVTRCEAASRPCLACGLIGRTVVQVERDNARARASCGSCPAGQACNTLYHPPRCAPARGTAGILCGEEHGAHRCADGYDCVGGQCVAKPGRGEPCAFAARGDVTHSGEGYCAPGLFCAPGDRCAPGCAEGCSSVLVCSPFETPPRCVARVALAGARCGPINQMERIECLPFHACVDRGAGGVCERGLGEGEACGSAGCPRGFVCDRAARTCARPPS